MVREVGVGKTMGNMTFHNGRSYMYIPCRKLHEHERNWLHLLQVIRLYNCQLWRSFAVQTNMRPSASLCLARVILLCKHKAKYNHNDYTCLYSVSFDCKIFKKRNRTVVSFRLIHYYYSYCNTFDFIVLHFVYLKYRCT